MTILSRSTFAGINALMGSSIPPCSFKYLSLTPIVLVSPVQSEPTLIVTLNVYVVDGRKVVIRYLLLASAVHGIPKPSDNMSPELAVLVLV